MVKARTVDDERKSSDLWKGNAGTRASYLRKVMMAGIARLVEAEDENGVLTHEAFSRIDEKMEELAIHAGIPFVRARTAEELETANRDLMHRFIHDPSSIWVGRGSS